MLESEEVADSAWKDVRIVAIQVRVGWNILPMLMPEFAIATAIGRLVVKAAATMLKLGV